MDRKHIDDQHIVARYLADQLSDSEREAFEAFCAKNPEMFRELEATARFKGGLARLAESGELANMVAKQPGFGSFVMRHAASLAAVGVGVAVLLGAVYALRVPAMGAMGASVADISGKQRTPLSVKAVPDLMRMRDAVDMRLKLPTERKALQFRVLPYPDTSPVYQATLSEETGSGTNRETSVRGLRPDDGGFVTFYVDSAWLAPGNYLLTVFPDDSRRKESESNFQIVVEAET